MRTIMPITTIPLAMVALLVTGVLSPSLAQPAQPTPVQPAPAQPAPAPCVQITAACLRAGFDPNGAKAGFGLVEDCIQPIMSGTPQRKQATKALPEIDPQLATACKQQNPIFGKGGRVDQPTTKPSAR
jgi:hypothetical protein